MQETILKVSQLRKALPYGAIRKIHDRLKESGVEISYKGVAEVIRGSYNNDKVIDVALEYLAEYTQEHKKKEAAIEQRLKQATNQAS